MSTQGHIQLLLIQKDTFRWPAEQTDLDRRKESDSGSQTYTAVVSDWVNLNGHW